MGSTLIQPEDDKSHPQSNAQVFEWNAAIQQALEQDDQLNTKVVYVDVWTASRQNTHKDPLHMMEQWYL